MLLPTSVISLLTVKNTIYPLALTSSKFQRYHPHRWLPGQIHGMHNSYEKLSPECLSKILKWRTFVDSFPGEGSISWEDVYKGQFLRQLSSELKFCQMALIKSSLPLATHLQNFWVLASGQKEKNRGVQICSSLKRSAFILRLETTPCNSLPVFIKTVFIPQLIFLTL